MDEIPLLRRSTDPTRDTRNKDTALGSATHWSMKIAGRDGSSLFGPGPSWSYLGGTLFEIVETHMTDIECIYKPNGQLDTSLYDLGRVAGPRWSQTETLVPFIKEHMPLIRAELIFN
jgi:hypothetical protein